MQLTRVAGESNRRGGVATVPPAPAPAVAGETLQSVDGYGLSPLVKVTRLHEDGSLVVHSGRGERRCHLALGGHTADEFVAWLMRKTSLAGLEDLGASLEAELGLASDDAKTLVRHLVDAEILVPQEEAAFLRRRLLPWHDYGWEEAGHFHLATYDLPFDPDELNGMSYPEYYNQMLLNTEDPAGEQPPALPVVTGSTVRATPAAPAWEQDGSVQDVLSRSAPVNRLGSRTFLAAQLQEPLMAAFGVRGRMGGALGEHHLRSYPSGGARHPFELYVVVKSLGDLDRGIYRFDPVDGHLDRLAHSADPDGIDSACFGKRGVETAPVALVLTCRWLRHGWKYRYARTYRMLMLEAGHIVQALKLSLLAADFFAFHSPSIDDAALRALLDIEDDCAEGPVYVLGVGRDGYYEDIKG